MSTFDRIIKGGMVVDGLRNPRYRADIGVKDGVIAEIGHLRASDAAEVIDASGLVVAPGFVDVHTHYDSNVFWDPYCSISGWHGVTTVVIGNCGFGFAPVPPESRDRAMLTMVRNEAIALEAMQQGMPWDWVTFPEYLDSVERTPKSVNVHAFFPLAPAMIWVMGMERAKAGLLPTDEEHAQMKVLLREALAAGAAGFSVQRSGQHSGQRDYDGTPMVTDIMHSETMLELAAVLGELNVGTIEYTYGGEPGQFEAAKRHIEQVAEVSRRPIIWNAVTSRAGFPELHRSLIGWLNGAIERGIRLHAQALTSDAGMAFMVAEDFNVWDESPAWCEATSGPREERKRKLSDPAMRQRMREQMPEGAAVIIMGEIGDLVVLRGKTPEVQKYDEMKIRDIAEIMGKDIVDTFCDIVVADDLETLLYAVGGNNHRPYLKELVAENFLIPGISDGGAHTKYLTAGKYPTEFIENYVREWNWVSLEEAHWRLSTFPAFSASVMDRTRGITIGAPADIIVYDYDRLTVLPEEIVHDQPAGGWRRIQRAAGYRYVLVNGQVTIVDDTETGTVAGHLLRHGRSPKA